MLRPLDAQQNVAALPMEQTGGAGGMKHVTIYLSWSNQNRCDCLIQGLN